MCRQPHHNNKPQQQQQPIAYDITHEQKNTHTIPVYHYNRACSCALSGRLSEGSRPPGCLLITAKPGASSACLVSRPNQNPPTTTLRERSSPPRVDRPPASVATAAAAAAAEVAASSSSTKRADGCRSEANLNPPFSTGAGTASWESNRSSYSSSNRTRVHFRSHNQVCSMILGMEGQRGGRNNI